MDIDVAEIAAKLKALGAVFVGEKHQKRYEYDLVPPRDGSWIRLRTDGETTTLTLKEIVDNSLGGTGEIEFGINDFEAARKFFEKLGYARFRYRENKRTSFRLDGAEIEIDEWPLIPPYLEVEARSAEEVEEAVRKLGFAMSDTTPAGPQEVYKKYGIDITAMKELKF